MLFAWPHLLHAAQNASAPLPGLYNPWLVGVSLVVAVLAAFAAFAVVDRIRASGRDRTGSWLWIGAGAVALGSGIWALHFIGMLAFELPVPVHYDFRFTLASIVPAIIMSGAAIATLTHEPMRAMRLQFAGLLLALGIGAMHYRGMEAMKLNATMAYQPALFALSLVVAHLLAVASLHVRFEPTPVPRLWRLPLASLLLGAAVAATHYLAMAAARFYPLAGDTAPTDFGVVFPSLLMALLICAFVAFILGLTIVSTAVHRRFTNAQTHLRLLLQAGDVGLWEWDLIANTTFYSAEWKRQLGYGDDELRHVASEWQSRLHPEDHDEAVARILACRDGEHATYQAEYRLRHKDGDWRWILSRATIERDTAGRPVRLVGSHVDISERKQAEANLRASEQRLRTIFETEPECVKVVSADGTVIEMNPAGLAMLEADSLADVQSRPLTDFLLPQHRAAYIALHQSVIAGGEGRLQYEAMGLRGTHRWLETHAAPMRDESGAVTMALAVTRDITQQKDSERAQHQHLVLSTLGAQVAIACTAHENLGQVLTACTDAIVSNLDADAARVWTLARADDALELRARAGYSLLGHARGERLALSGASAIARVARTRIPYRNDAIEPGEAMCSEWGGTDQTVSRVAYPLLLDNRVLGVLSVSARRPFEDAAIDALGVVARNMSLAIERKSVEEALRRAALVDRLTQLPNRAMVTDRLRQLLAQAGERPSCIYAVLFLDLDNFKYVNDSLGHDAGDRMLIETASRLTRVLRQGDALAAPCEDVAGRFGGDEFVIVLDRLDRPEDAARVAERILLAMAEPFQLGAQTLTVSCSIGISTSQRTYAAVEDLLRDADTALYQAKAAGKAHYVMFDEPMHMQARKRLSLENDLRAAIHRGHIYALYQPIVDLRTGRVTAFEALARWAHPTHGAISPDEFIPIAEETGLIVPIGQLILEQAVATMERLSRVPGGEAICMNVNVSRRQLVDASLLGSVADILRRLSVPAERLRLEITETAVTGTPAIIHDALRKLKALGVKIHLDDFGAGLSSLSLLRTLPLDGIKVDRSFIEAADGDLQAITILNAIIGLGHNLGKRITAEGIAEQSQVATVLALDCDEAQGFIFGHPVEADEAAAVLSRDFSFVCVAV